MSKKYLFNSQNVLKTKGFTIYQICSKKIVSIKTVKNDTLNFKIITKKSIVCICSAIGSFSLFGQDIVKIKNPPVIIEPMFGSNRIYVQALINKQFQAKSVLGYFSANSLSAEWGNNTAEIMNQAYLTFQLSKTITTNIGYHYTSITGARPTASILYTYTRANWLFIFFPRIDLTQNPNTETFTMVEYKEISERKVNLYSRIQCLYVYNLEDKLNQRSYVYFRLGVRYKEFILGGATNIDFYEGTNPIKKDFGIFVEVQLF